jgi:hypothetical protein
MVQKASASQQKKEYNMTQAIAASERRAKEGKKESFVALNPDFVQDQLEGLLGSGWDIRQTRRTKYTKAALAYGGPGTVSIVSARARETFDGMQTELRVRDQDFAGAKLEVQVGFFRLVCTNGLTVFERGATPIRVAHRISDEQELLELPAAISEALARVERSKLLVQELKERRIDPRQVLDGLKLGERLTQALLYGRPRREDDIRTVWGLYNYINEMDRLTARKGSLAYLERDETMLNRILEVA